MNQSCHSHDTARFSHLLGRDIARLPLAVVWRLHGGWCSRIITVMK
ncbi:hypothetical protein ACLB1O_16895 [Escherichia coli]